MESQRLGLFAGQESANLESLRCVIEGAGSVVLNSRRGVAKSVCWGQLELSWETCGRIERIDIEQCQVHLATGGHAPLREECC